MRRDNCPLVANLINTCLHKILVDRFVECTYISNFVKHVHLQCILNERNPILSIRQRGTWDSPLNVSKLMYIKVPEKIAVLMYVCT